MLYLFSKRRTSRRRKSFQNLDIDTVDKSLNEPINSKKMKKLYHEKIERIIFRTRRSPSSLIGAASLPMRKSPGENQTYIKRELQASLYDGDGNTCNGILGDCSPLHDSRVYIAAHRNVLLQEKNTIWFKLTK